MGLWVALRKSASGRSAEKGEPQTSRLRSIYARRRIEVGIPRKFEMEQSVSSARAVACLFITSNLYAMIAGHTETRLVKMGQNRSTSFFCIS